MKKNNRNNEKLNQFSILLPILTIVGIGFTSFICMDYDPSWNFNWTEIRKDIKDSIELAEYRGITSGAGGMGRSTEYEVKTRIWVMENATESELLKLTEYPNGTIKTIAYEGLLRNKNFNKKAELTLKALKDTTYLLSYQAGCIGWDRKIGEYIIHDVLIIDDQGPPPPKNVKKIVLTEDDKKKILSEYRKTEI